MICEMCGREVPVTRTCIIEGSRMDVCPNCARFGEEYRAQSAGGVSMTQSVIDERLQRRERRMQTKDIYAGTTSVEVVDDYGGLIRDTRTAMGMDQAQFASLIQEKKGTVAKIETNSLMPDDKLMKKIEKALNIKLTETVSSGASVGGQNRSAKMTLENFIRKG